MSKLKDLLIDADIAAEEVLDSLRMLSLFEYDSTAAAEVLDSLRAASSSSLRKSPGSRLA